MVLNPKHWFFRQPDHSHRLQMALLPSGHRITVSNASNRRCYEVIECLSVGSFSQVYLCKAIHEPGQPLCMVKSLQPAVEKPTYLQVTQQLLPLIFETPAAEQPIVYRILDYFEDKHRFYLVQAYADPLTIENGSQANTNSENHSSVASSPSSWAIAEQGQSSLLASLISPPSTSNSTDFTPESSPSKEAKSGWHWLLLKVAGTGIVIAWILTALIQATAEDPSIAHSSVDPQPGDPLSKQVNRPTSNSNQLNSSNQSSNTLTPPNKNALVSQISGSLPNTLNSSGVPLTQFRQGMSGMAMPGSMAHAPVSLSRMSPQPTNSPAVRPISPELPVPTQEKQATRSVLSTPTNQSSPIPATNSVGLMKQLSDVTLAVLNTTTPVFKAQTSQFIDPKEVNHSTFSNQSNPQISQDQKVAVTLKVDYRQANTRATAESAAWVYQTPERTTAKTITQIDIVKDRTAPLSKPHGETKIVPNLPNQTVAAVLPQQDTFEAIEGSSSASAARISTEEMPRLEPSHEVSTTNYAQTVDTRLSSSTTLPEPDQANREIETPDTTELLSTEPIGDSAIVEPLTETVPNHSCQNPPANRSEHFLAGICEGNVIKVWDISTAEVKYSFQGGDNSWKSVEISPDGKVITASSIDDQQSAWSLQTGESF